VLALVTMVVAACVVALLVWRSGGNQAGPAPASPTTPTPAPVCPTALAVVTAASFEPVLNAVAQRMATGENCARLEITAVDGRAAAVRVAELAADLWIPDDTAWAGLAGNTKLAKPDVAGSGTVVATSPIYFVASPPTAQQLTQAGGSWRALARLLTGNTGFKMVVRDPAGSGDGLVAAGSVGEAVWVDQGMNASAEALMNALPATRTVPGDDPALPGQDGEVGLVPEYALLSALGHGRVGVASTMPTVLAPTDNTALLRYTWLPADAAAKDPALAKALQRLLQALTGEQGAQAIAAAGLRSPQGAPPPEAAAAGLPAVSAAPFKVLALHHVEHVFAAWYAEDRRADVLLVIDVSGSMGDPAPGTKVPLIELVVDGVKRLGQLLPDDAQLALWEFGSRLDPPRDYAVLLPAAPLTGEHRQALANVVQNLKAKQTGTGLYDTLLAAYIAARDAYRPGVANHVVLFTDGRNEFDPDSISAGQLSSRLDAAKDPNRPVQLTVVTFGPEPEAKVLSEALKPVNGSVDPLTTADEVRAVFIHAAAGGLHG
jgi:hypothetical protein